MRKVTNNAVNAFLAGRPFKESNTEVEVLPLATYLKLFNNIIAVKYVSGKLQISNAGWRTSTTKERLNALPGVSITQNKGVWYLNGKYWDGILIDVK